MTWRAFARWFKWGLGVSTVLTIITTAVVLERFSADRPKFSVAQANQVFDRYPYWQDNTMRSRDVIFTASPAAGLANAGAAAPTVSPAALLKWRQGASSDVVLELGIGQ